MLDYTDDFFSRFNGDTGPFDMYLQDTERAPTAAGPTLDDDTTSGSLSARTYGAVFAWYDATYGETTQSALGSISAAANKVVTFEVPVAPTRVTSWRVYAYESPATTLYLQQTVTGTRTWTEPDSGLVTGTAQPVSTNTLKPLHTWRIVSDFNPVKVASNRWRLEITIAEQIA